MSIVVPLEELPARIAQRGAGYLLTASADSRPHVVHLEFGVDGVELRASVGRTAASNIMAQPEVSVLWPGTNEHTYSLIVDGTATVEGAEGDATAVITSTGAVLHRPAPPPA